MPFKGALSRLSQFLAILDFLVIYKDGLIKKKRLFSNFVTSQPG